MLAIDHLALSIIQPSGISSIAGWLEPVNYISDLLASWFLGGSASGRHCWEIERHKGRRNLCGFFSALVFSGGAWKHQREGEDKCRLALGWFLRTGRGGAPPALPGRAPSPGSRSSWGIICSRSRYPTGLKMVVIAAGAANPQWHLNRLLSITTSGPHVLRLLQPHRWQVGNLTFPSSFCQSFQQFYNYSLHGFFVFLNEHLIICLL